MDESSSETTAMDESCPEPTPTEASSPEPTPTDESSPEPKSKRRRCRRACDACRFRKTKCDVAVPCARCIESETVCTFEEFKIRKSGSKYIQELRHKLQRVELVLQAVLPGVSVDDLYAGGDAVTKALERSVEGAGGAQEPCFASPFSATAGSGTTGSHTDSSSMPSFEGVQNDTLDWAFAQVLDHDVQAVSGPQVPSTGLDDLGFILAPTAEPHTGLQSMVLCEQLTHLWGTPRVSGPDGILYSSAASDYLSI